MDATRRMEIELPEEVADAVRAHVESVRFENESAVVQAGLELLDEQGNDADELEAWLKSTVPQRAKDLEERRGHTKPIAGIRHSLLTTSAEGDRPE